MTLTVSRYVKAPQKNESESTGCTFPIAGGPMMQWLDSIFKMLSGMSVETLVAIVVLAAFGLAAYAIFAMLKVVTGRR